VVLSDQELQKSIEELQQRERESQVTRACRECTNSTDLGRLQATISELRAAAAVSEATIEKLNAEMVRVKDNCLAWIKHGKEAHKLMIHCQLRSDAWDELTDHATNKQIEDAIRTFNLRDKMANLAILAGICVQKADTYNELRRKVLLATHPDKHRETLTKEVLFEKICKTVNNMPPSL